MESNKSGDLVLTLSQIAPIGKNSSQKSEKVFDGDSCQRLQTDTVSGSPIISDKLYRVFTR